MTDLPVGGVADVPAPLSLLLVSIIDTDIYCRGHILLPRMTYFADFL